MVQTQIYLTERQCDELAAIAKTSGKKQNELIREAVDRFIDQEGRNRVKGYQNGSLRRTEKSDSQI